MIILGGHTFKIARDTGGAWIDGIYTPKLEIIEAYGQFSCISLLEIKHKFYGLSLERVKARFITRHELLLPSDGDTMQVSHEGDYSDILPTSGSTVRPGLGDVVIVGGASYEVIAEDRDGVIQIKNQIQYMKGRHWTPMGGVRTYYLSEIVPSLSLLAVGQFE